MVQDGLGSSEMVSLISLSYSMLVFSANSFGLFYKRCDNLAAFSFLGTVGDENQELELSASNRGMFIFIIYII